MEYIDCRSRLTTDLIGAPTGTNSPERMKCPCGKTVLKSLYLSHCKSQKHNRFLATGVPYVSHVDENYEKGDWRRYRFSKMRCLKNYFKRVRLRNKMFDNNIDAFDPLGSQASLDSASDKNNEQSPSPKETF